jgi:Flp pilus assembly protein TadG
MRHRENEQGVVMVYIALGMTTLALFLALALDVGEAYLARTQLQGAADAGARAALQVLMREGGTQAQARAVAVQTANGSTVVNGGVQIAPTDVVFGDFDYNTNSFRAGQTLLAVAVQVTARRSQGSVSGPLDGLLLDMDVNAMGVAAATPPPCRDVVAVLDTTASFQDEIDQAKAAVLRLVDLLSDGRTQTRLGLVTFDVTASVRFPLVSLPSARSQFRMPTPPGVPNIEACPCSSNCTCTGTDQAVGIDAARQLFANSPSSCGAEKLIILVSDGVPCRGNFGPGGRTQGGTTQGAIAAADRADSASIHLSPIMYIDPGGVQCSLSGYRSPADFNDALARGRGQAYDTPNASQLSSLIQEALETSAAVKIVN